MNQMLREGKTRISVSDPRSECLHQVLNYAMKTRAAVVVLECTVPAGKDRWVRDTIQAWCRASQFVMKEVELHLEHVWPTKRSRWWAALVPPVLAELKLAQFPKVTQWPKWPEDAVRQLELDKYELHR